MFYFCLQCIVLFGINISNELLFYPFPLKAKDWSTRLKKTWRNECCSVHFGLDSAAIHRRGWKKCREQRAPAWSWARRRLVPCWYVSERSRREGGPCFPLLLCVWCLASRPFAMKAFLIPGASPLFYCSVAFGDDGGLWGVSRRAPVEGSTSPTGAPPGSVHPALT